MTSQSKTKKCITQLWTDCSTQKTTSNNIDYQLDHKELRAVKVLANTVCLQGTMNSGHWKLCNAYIRKWFFWIVQYWLYGPYELLEQRVLLEQLNKVESRLKIEQSISLIYHTSDQNNNIKCLASLLVKEIT